MDFYFVVSGKDVQTISLLNVWQIDFHKIPYFKSGIAHYRAKQIEVLFQTFGKYFKLEGQQAKMFPEHLK